MHPPQLLVVFVFLFLSLSLSPSLPLRLSFFSKRTKHVLQRLFRCNYVYTSYCIKVHTPAARLRFIVWVVHGGAAMQSFPTLTYNSKLLASMARWQQISQLLEVRL